MPTDRIARLERTNRRLTLALVALGGVGFGAVLAGFAQPGQPTPPDYVGIAIHDEVDFMYRMDAKGNLERLSLKGGRVAGGGTPAEWKAFPVGTEPRSP